jgi:hypothetical protein
MGTPSAAHEAEVDKERQEREAAGQRVIRIRRLPPLIAFNGTCIIAVVATRMRRRPGRGWHAKTTRGTYLRHYPGFDDVIIVKSYPESAGRDAESTIRPTLNRLRSEGYRLIRTARKRPDLLAIHDGRIIAVEVLLVNSTKEAEHWGDQKLLHYAMFDDVQFRLVQRPPRVVEVAA